MKPNYKAIQPHEWEEIFKAGGIDFKTSPTRIDVFEKTVEVIFIDEYGDDVFENDFNFESQSFDSGHEFNHIAAIQKMSEFIDIGIGNNMPKEEGTTAKRILLDELDEQPHPERVEDVIFWALEHYCKRGKGTMGEMVAYAIKQRILDEEKEKKS